MRILQAKNLSDILCSFSCWLKSLLLDNFSHYRNNKKINYVLRKQSASVTSLQDTILYVLFVNTFCWKTYSGKPIFSHHQHSHLYKSECFVNKRNKMLDSSHNPFKLILLLWKLTIYFNMSNWSVSINTTIYYVY